MKLLDWRRKNWWQRALLVLTVVAAVILASHPELRLLLPLVDSMGLDLLLVLMGSQVLGFAKPSLAALYRHLLRPSAACLYSLAIFFLGIAGPYVDGLLAPRNHLNGSSA